MTQKTPSIFKKSSDLAILTVISRILGLVRESVTAAFLGTGALADAFAVAFLVPNVLRRLFAEGVISAAFIPPFKGFLSEDRKDEAASFLNAAFSVVTLFAFVIVASAMIFSGNLTHLLAPSLDSVNAGEAAFLAEVMFPYVLFISVAALVQSVLNSFGIFRPSGFSPILFNIFFITAALLFGQMTANPARAMAFGVLLGGAAQLFFQLPFMLKKTPFRFSFVSLKKAFSHPAVRKSWWLALASLIGTGSYQINILLTTNIANSAGEGTVSSLSFSSRIEELIIGIFVVSLSTVILPEFTADVRKGDMEKLGKTLDSALKFVAFVSLPALFFTLFNSGEMVSLLFGFGSFGEKSVEMTAYALRFHIAGLFFIASARILNSLFYAAERPLVPIFAGLLSIAVNFAAALLLVKSMKGGGVAFAATLGAASSAIVLFIVSAIIFKGSAVKLKLFGYFAKIIIISICSVAASDFFKPFVKDFFSAGKLGSLCSFLSISAVFATVFIGMSMVTKDETLILLKNAAAEKFSIKKTCSGE